MARQHIFKNIDVELPRDALVVFTGVSGWQVLTGFRDALC